MAYHKLAKFINHGQWEMAEQEFLLHQDDIWTDELSILAATLFFHNGQYEEAYRSIQKGLDYNHANYELYLLLGNYYFRSNINQAWLCYENAQYYCDNKEDLDIILQYKTTAEQFPEWNVKKTSIVIPSYNLKSITQQCIASIKQNNLLSSFEIIVVDNNSTDGIKEWLQCQTDIKLICNKENKGFPFACNQGIKAAGPENNIFLLNNDTFITPNAIFWLRMGLYENENIGATGSVSNYPSHGQPMTEECRTLEEYIAYGCKNNVPRKNPYEKKPFLTGFALMLKREALDMIGLLDVRFSPGQFEDDDLGIRLNLAGWQVILCDNSFIFHYGSGEGKYQSLWNQSFDANIKKFIEKWDFDIRYYTFARQEIISLINHDWDAPIKVLEVGCGLGATLSKIKYLWPNSKVYGIEIVDCIAQIGANYLDILQGNIETMSLPFLAEQFDYIILADVLEHLYEPEQTIKHLMPYLKGNGSFLCSIPNIMHVSVLLPLLQGKFDYTNSGVCDKTHIKFFTLNSIAKLFQKYADIENLTGNFGGYLTEEEQQMLNALENVPKLASKTEFQVCQYIFSARKKENVLSS